MHFLLQSSANKTASGSGTPLQFGSAGLRALRDVTAIVFTLDVTAASAGGTFDVWVTTSDGFSSWDIVHFPQVTGGGAKRYTARVELAAVIPQSVTTAAPGVAANDPSTLNTITPGSAQGIRTLAAGAVSHGPVGEIISHELVCGGTVGTGVTYTLSMDGW